MSRHVVLEVSGLSKSFGGVRAVADVSFSLASGEVTALIGPNGAGKTTLINLVTGVWMPDGGNLLLDGVNLSGMPAHRRGKAGIARTYQNSADGAWHERSL